MTGDFDTMFKAIRRGFAGRLILTSAMACGVAVSAVALLGLLSWFLTEAAIAGAAGPIAAQAFNYLLPAAAIRFLAIARTGLRYGERLIGHGIALRAMAQLRPALFERMLTIAPEILLRLGRGDASSRFVHDVGALENDLVLRSAPPSAIAGTVTALVLAALGSLAAALTLAVFMAVSLGGALWIHRRLPAQPMASESETVAALKGRFQELLTILPDIRTSDPQNRFDLALEQIEDRLMATRAGTVSRDAVAQGWLLLVTGIGLATMAVASLHAPLPGLALALLAAGMGFENLAVLIKAMGQRQTKDQAHRRIAELYDQGGASVKEPGTLSEPFFVHGARPFALDGRLRLRIDGPSGQGKTRLIEGLIGLRDLPDLSGSFDTSLFALAPQDAAVLTGSVRHNLMMANPGLSDDLLWQALDDAGLAQRMRTLPRGLDTWIGDGGITLSGGERKRLALARAYLRQVPVLILDEPTEGLDAATEALVVERLEHRLTRTGQGLILISHRQAPRRLATDILALQ